MLISAHSLSSIMVMPPPKPAFFFVKWFWSLAQRNNDLLLRAALARRNGDITNATLLFHQLVLKSRLALDAEKEQLSLFEIGHIAFESGNLEEAERKFNEALHVVHVSAKDKESLLIEASLAEVQYAKADLTKSRIQFQKVLTKATLLKDYHLEYLLLCNLGLIGRRLNIPEEAIAYYEEAIEMSEKNSDAERLASVCYNLGSTEAELGAMEEGLRLIKYALELFNSLGAKFEAEVCESTLSKLYALPA